MKKIMCLLLALQVVLFLCACGKSEPAKTTDAQTMEALETVDLQQDRAAEDKALQEAMSGEWVDIESYLRAQPITMTLEGQGVVTLNGMVEKPLRSWWKVENGEIFIDGFNSYERNMEETNGVSYLQIKGTQFTFTFVKSADFEKIFEVVELTNENVSDYIEIVDVPYQRKNDAGEVEHEGTAVWLASKVYEQGLWYVQEDFETGVKIEVKSPKGKMVNSYSPFGVCSDDFWQQEGFYSQITAEKCTFSNANGKIYFVRSEYATMKVENGTVILEVLGTKCDRWNRVREANYSVLDEEYLYY